MRVRIAWGRSLSHRLSGNLGSTVHRPDIKWDLNVCMARSALLRLWIPAGVSWKSTFSEYMKSLRMMEASLSSRWRRG